MIYFNLLKRVLTLSPRHGLTEIKQLMEDPALDREEILLVQQAVLERKRNRLNGIIELIQDVRKGVNTMSFAAFSEEDIEKIVDHTIKQAKY